MRNKGKISLGIILIFTGILLIIANLLNISFWSIFWPTGFIGLGVWLIIHQKKCSLTYSTDQKIIGDITYRGAWRLTNKDIYLGIGDIVLDLTQAETPSGKTQIRIYGFIGEIDIRVPKNLGISVSCTGFITDTNILGQKDDKFFATLYRESKNFSTTRKQIQLESTFFISEIKIVQT